MTGITLRRLTVLGFAVLLGAAGCAKTWSQNDNVEGTLKLDGVPLANVSVRFVPDDAKVQGPSSSGYTDDKGHFQLTCENAKSGAILGKHNVILLQGRTDAGEHTGPAIPPVYTMAPKTPLQIEVTAGEHNYDLNISRFPPPRK